MKIDQWLTSATTRLSTKQIPSARLDALILLEDVLNKPRTWLLAHPEHELTQAQLSQLENSITRRAQHEPLAYIRGRSEFYGREFIVSPATLQPRPETETMIDLFNVQVIPRCQKKSCTVVDVGTGSGCIAITVKLEHPELTVSATEINKEALQIAAQNVKKLSADIQLQAGNLLEPLIDSINSESIILANLPYVPDAHTINQAAMHEPVQAIFGGQDGLDLYREMFAMLNALSGKPSWILTESLPFQHDTLATIALAAGYRLHASDDFIQVFTL